MAHGAVIGAVDSQLRVGPGSSTSFDFELGISAQGNSATIDNLLFALDLLTVEVGDVFMLDSGSAFDGATTLLTNGANDTVFEQLFFSSGGSISSLSPEAFYFFGDAFGNNGIDFLGANITKISLSINENEFNPGAPQDGTPEWFDLNYTITLEGAPGPNPIPEPSTVSLLGFGVLATTLWTRRRR